MKKFDDRMMAIGILIAIIVITWRIIDFDWRYYEKFVPVPFNVVCQFHPCKSR